LKFFGNNNSLSLSLSLSLYIDIPKPLSVWKESCYLTTEWQHLYNCHGDTLRLNWILHANSSLFIITCHTIIFTALILWVVNNGFFTSRLRN
jgi:hypothetical protein